jgi:SulP family sulfate permease
MTGHPVKLETLPLLLQTNILSHWLPGVAFGGFLFVLLKKAKQQLLMPLVLLLAIAFFYFVATVAGKSVPELRANGWLPDFPSHVDTGSITIFSVLKVASWSLLLKHLNILATILLTSMVSILLTASALELSSQQEIDFNRELRSAGLATFIAGMAGGMVGFHSLSLSRLALSMGARSRWVGAVSALLCGIALFWGASMVSFVPQYVCGGLLFFLGAVFLWEWVYEASRKLTRLDYIVVLFILAVVGAVGYPEGVATGIIAAVVLFVHNYSRINVVSHALSGATLRSNVERPLREIKLLRERGEQVYALRLQGFIFFGTATRLLQEVQARATDGAIQRLRFVIMDFRRVSGLDSSAAFSLWKVYQLGNKLGFTLIMSQVRPDILKQLEMGGLRQKELSNYLIFPDLDHSLEWCERSLLNDVERQQNGAALHLAEQLNDMWPKGINAERLLPYLERKEIPKSTHLIRQSEVSQCLYFVESGQVTAKLEMDGSHSMRLRTQGAGTVVGEVGLFLGGKRTASVVTEEPSIVYLLSAEALQRMRKQEPDLALAFHEFVVRLLAERLTTASNMLRDFQQ